MWIFVQQVGEKILKEELKENGGHTHQIYIRMFYSRIYSHSNKNINVLFF